MAVVAQGPLSDGIMPVIVRNNTDEPVADVGVAGTARDASGAIVSSGEDQGLRPDIVAPGQVALGYVYFGLDVSLPAETTYTFDVTSSPAGEAFSAGGDLDVVEVSQVESRIVGQLKNSTEEDVTGPIGLQVLCFESTGSLASSRTGFASQDQAPVGATVSFQIDLFKPCPTFLLAGGGYSF